MAWSIRYETHAMQTITKPLDVLIIGAGLSGVGTACHIAREFPNKTIALIERRKTLGGTWDLFRYPGIRSDSDMASFGYGFKPWLSSKVLADGPAIRDYVIETAKEFKLYEKTHFSLQTQTANWSSEDKLWTLVTRNEDSGEEQVFTCRYLISCTGYFNHDYGYRPEFPGEENFKGQIIHPQQWPEDLDYSNKRVVVIGSGATAVTLLPAMAEKVSHITMLQRSPSYVFALPNKDKVSDALGKFLPGSVVFKLARGRNIAIQRALYISCRRWPNAMRKFLLSQVEKQIGPDIDMRHFTPKYMPWDERLCVVPDGDLFKALLSGKASIETDHIDRFTEKGILLKSGKELEADIIISATGLTLQMLGGMAISVDGEARPLNEQMVYKGLLIENMPNLAWVFGYTNAPWTLKADLAGRYLCRLFKHMDAEDKTVAMPVSAPGIALDVGIVDSLQSGYVQRAKDIMPRQGKQAPWQVTMHYGKDKAMLLKDAVADEALRMH